MGLGITAYSNLVAAGRHTDGWCQEEDHVKAFAYDSFPASFRGIPVLSTSAGGLGEGFFEGGCYALTDATVTHSFSAGSYGGYNRWRADLQTQFNPDRDPEAPFYELIWFADNEGCIGPDAAKDLLADFREHEAAYISPDQFDREGRLYRDWLRAFDLAAVGGLVNFH